MPKKRPPAAACTLTAPGADVVAFMDYVNRVRGIADELWRQNRCSSPWRNGRKAWRCLDSATVSKMCCWCSATYSMNQMARELERSLADAIAAR